jgi:hypothetical protein
LEPLRVKVRKFQTTVEEILHEGGPGSVTPLRRAAAAAVIENPYAGRYESDIQPLMKLLEPLGLDMARRLVTALGGDASVITSYGKGAIVGGNGELEHGAVWHVPGGYAMREILGGAKAIVPSSKKLGAIGCSLDIPITHKDAAYVRSHFDAMTVSIPDAPRANELVVILVMTTGGRIHERVGGLKAHEIKGADGLR